jgi:16S rRNA processing protein RimM
MVIDKGSPVVVGRIGRTVGVSGWLRVISFTNPQDNLLKLNSWLVKDLKTASWQKFPYQLKKHAKTILVKFSGYESPEQAKCLTGAEIAVSRNELLPLDVGEYYWVDLLGIKVVNVAGVELGVIKELMATGSNDVLVVVREKSRVLIPFLDWVVLEVNLADHRMVVDWDGV